MVIFQPQRDASLGVNTRKEDGEKEIEACLSDIPKITETHQPKGLPDFVFHLDESVSPFLV